MIERAFIHVGGPPGAGKTTFIEALLAAADSLVLVARCIRDDTLRRREETAPKSHPELKRYREAGAADAALFAFRVEDTSPFEFFDTHLMEDYSEAVVLEGYDPLDFVDLKVFVTPALSPDEALFVRRKRDRAAEGRTRIDALARQLGEPDGVARVLGQMIGGQAADFARNNPQLLEQGRKEVLAVIAASQKAPAPPPTEHWAIADRFSGIEHAQLIVVNIREEAERERGERLVAEVGRLRKEKPLFDDILGFRGTKIPVTAVAANLSERRDPGRKKALARARRVLRAKARQGGGY